MTKKCSKLLISLFVWILLKSDFPDNYFDFHNLLVDYTFYRKLLLFNLEDSLTSHSHSPTQSQMPRSVGENWREKCKNLCLKTRTIYLKNKQTKKRKGKIKGGKKKGRKIKGKKKKNKQNKWCNCSPPTNWCPKSVQAVAALLAKSPQFYCLIWYYMVWNIPSTRYSVVLVLS